jgi:hypothetical protein
LGSGEASKSKLKFGDLTVLLSPVEGLWPPLFSGEQTAEAFAGKKNRKYALEFYCE